MTMTETLAQLARWHDTQASRSEGRDKIRHKLLASGYWRQVLELDNPADQT